MRVRVYQMPVNVFATEEGYVNFALTYGPDTDWVKNVLTADGCELWTRGRCHSPDLTRACSRLLLSR
jgi:putative N-acetylmannosamine-6-phosphate epimerase